jgi:transcription initiation factor TFIIF subunit beta
MNKLFLLFSEKPYWGIPALKQTLQQPDAYIRECLSEIAVLITEGVYAHQWRLMDNYANGGVGEFERKVGAKDGMGVDGDEEEEEEEDDEDGEEEDDFEEIIG